jgi:hypothetical protein
MTEEEITNASYIAETYHEIDYDKVNSVEDIKLILNALGIKFTSNHPKFNTIEPLLKK